MGANWSYKGWNLEKMRRLPNTSDTGGMELWPNISVTTRDMDVKKIVTAIWVRERADIHDPGVIYGVSHLQETMPADARTIGGDPLKLPGPLIKCEASDFTKIFNCPVFIQTTDGEFFQAQSPGNLMGERILHDTWSSSRLQCIIMHHGT